MRCPVCRAEVEQGPNCRRCRADLSLLFALEEQRQRALATAYRLLHERRLGSARAVAEGACALRGDAESNRLLAVVALLHRNFRTAWKSYQAARALPGQSALLESK
jgi:hypothetical protein